MANVVFGGQHADKIGPVVEEKLRKELNLPSPIPYTVETANADKTSVATVLKDMGSIFSGGQADLLFTLVFDLPGSFARASARGCRNYWSRPRCPSR